MPTHLKTLVRSRMAKTGESYATALRYVRRRGDRALAARAAAAAPAPVSAPAIEPDGAPRVRYAGARRRDPAIDAHVRAQTGPRGGILARLVALARAAAPSHDEILFRGAPSFCIDGEPYCYIVGYPRHLNLGFCDGASLPDPDRLLRGRGRWMRHVRVAPGEPLPAAAIAELIAASARRVRALRAANPAGAKEVGRARR
jgi:hypothetical protein